MGEVVIADETITGTGVVLAQRLEQLAEAGGVVIQGAAYETIPGRFPFEYENLGERELKGFDEPVRAYGVALVREGQVPTPEGTQAEAAVESVDGLSARASIAVLPFDNLSGDPEQEYFADGVVEDIITDLSRFNDLLVIARNSSFSYKGKSIKIQRVASELGVRYVVEGRVRRAAKRLRIMAQLIDAADESHVWGERYDRELHDVFAVQGETYRPRLTTGSRAELLLRASLQCGSPR